jgi:glycosyltransferase involved in cell wall biosynthesis
MSSGRTRSPATADAALRVAIVFGTFPPERNGGADFVARFSDALAEHGAVPNVLTSPSPGAPEREELDSGVIVHRVVDEWALSSSARKAVRRIDELLVAERVDVLHVFFPDSVLQSRYQVPAALGLGRIPLVTTFWNLGLGRRSPAAIKLEALALLARSAVLTSHDPRYLRALRLGAGWARPVHWLPVGTNLDRPAGRDAAAVRARLGVGDAALLGYFGHLDFTRGIEDLFQALALLRRRRDVRLAMIGATGERGGRYRSLARELGIDGAVVWTGYLPAADAADTLAAVDLCVLPYRRNSLGRSALAAAFAVGAPTILGGSPAGIAPLRPGKHVELVAPGDSERLATLVGELLDDPGRRSRLSAGAQSASRLFAWPRIAMSAVSLYREATSRKIAYPFRSRGFAATSS